MSHPLNTDFWYGWPAVIAIAYFALAFVASPDMTLATRLWASGGGGLILVCLYWVLWRLVGWLVPSRQRAQPADD